MEQTPKTYRVQKHKVELCRSYLFAEDEDYTVVITAVNREKRLVRCACSDGKERELPIFAVRNLEIA
jgi:hypothetical protein